MLDAPCPCCARLSMSRGDGTGCNRWPTARCARSRRTAGSRSRPSPACSTGTQRRPGHPGRRRGRHRCPRSRGGHAAADRDPDRTGLRALPLRPQRLLRPHRLVGRRDAAPARPRGAPRRRRGVAREPPCWRRSGRARGGCDPDPAAGGPAELLALRRRGFPFVVVDPRTPPPPDVAAVSAAHVAGARAVTAHLLELGHRRIGVIAGPQEWLAGRRPARRAPRGDGPGRDPVRRRR